MQPASELRIFWIFVLFARELLSFSVTSSDDEIDLSFLPAEYRQKAITQNVVRYEGTHNYFYLVNDGNAVNFLHNAVLGEFIQLVKGGLFVATKNLAEGKAMQRTYARTSRPLGFDSLCELDSDDQRDIATLWMDTVLLGVKWEAE